ncbi:MAG: DUF4912 domain-containing protein [Verrucomicrobiales bacterium]|jgi:hypothetical protein|nr:DUF4912 domain-containing protein [Verrucomicrobiales bacterium]
MAKKINRKKVTPVVRGAKKSTKPAATTTSAAAKPKTAARPQPARRAKPVKVKKTAAAKPPAPAKPALAPTKKTTAPAPRRKPAGPAKKSPPRNSPPPRDPVINPPADDADASQTAKFTVNTAVPGPPPASRPAAPEYEDLGELPEAYGTKKLYLTARDPHWLYAYWDLTSDQIGAAERQAHDGKVFLQLYTADGERLQQIHLSPWTREWYLGTRRPGHTFYAEVGYYRRDGRFEVITRSARAATPRASLSWRAEARFATIPFALSFRELAAIVSAHARPGEAVVETLARLQRDDFPLPFNAGALPDEATHRALLDYINHDLTRRVRMGSDEIAETVSGLYLEELSSNSGREDAKPQGFV